VKLRFNLLTEVEPIFMHIKKSHTSHTKRDFWFICENEVVMRSGLSLMCLFTVLSVKAN
jgi:hypothetical protein